MTMQTTNIKQAAPMTYYQRNTYDNPARFRPMTDLPPRDLFTDRPDVLAAYDQLVTLNDATRNHQRRAASKRAAAETARADYQAAVTNALKAGQDPSKLKTKAEQYEAEAKAHETFAKTSLGRADVAARDLGEKVKASACDLFGPAEDTLCHAADAVGSLLEALTAALQRYGQVWENRYFLSRAHFAGGLLVWHGGEVPREALQAIDALRAQCAAVDRLKSDERVLTDWRAQQAEAREQGVRLYGSH